MSGDWIDVAFTWAACALWYWVGRSHGKAKADKRAYPYVTFALPVFKAMRVDGAHTVLVEVARKGEHEWEASQTTLIEPADKEHVA